MSSRSQLGDSRSAGSPLYLSPEVWQTGTCSHKSDVWSIGCVAYELLAHRPPFAAPELAYKVLTTTPAPLPALYSAALKKLVFEMLHKEPGARPGTEELLRHPSMACHIKRLLAAGFSAAE